MLKREELTTLSDAELDQVTGGGIGDVLEAGVEHVADAIHYVAQKVADGAQAVANEFSFVPPKICSK